MTNKPTFYWYQCIALIALYVMLSIPVHSKRSYNWDMMAYMAIALKLDGKTDTIIHKEVYRIINQKLDQPKYNRLIGNIEASTIRTFGVNNDVQFRSRMFKDANAFIQQLAFYDIKILYVLVIFICYKLGIPLLTATIIPSLLSFIFCGVFISFWLGRAFKSLLLGTAVALLIFNLPIVFAAARIVSPDFLAASFILLTAYSTIESRKRKMSTLWLCLAILTRPDTIIFAYVLLSALLFRDYIKQEHNYRTFIWSLVLCTVSFMMHRVWSDNPGWPTLFYHSFYEFNISPITDPKNGVLLSDYTRVLKKGLLQEIIEFRLYLLAILAYTIWKLVYVPSDLQKWMSHYTIIIYSMTIFLILRFLLFPILDERLLIGGFLTIITLSILEIVLRSKDYSKAPLL